MVRSPAAASWKPFFLVLTELLQRAVPDARSKEPGFHTLRNYLLFFPKLIIFYNLDLLFLLYLFKIYGNSNLSYNSYLRPDPGEYSILPQGREKRDRQRVCGSSRTISHAFPVRRIVPPGNGAFEGEALFLSGSVDVIATSAGRIKTAWRTWE
jgi:hypothetical protein